MSSVQPIDEETTGIRTLRAQATAKQRQLEGELASARAERDQLELELALTQVRVGDREPPVAIETLLDARLWLAWAHEVGHQAGCLCHRCPKARRMLARNP